MRNLCDTITLPERNRGSHSNIMQDEKVTLLFVSFNFDAYHY